ncbi:MAG: diguanylate cyclase [Abditibacteriota bacterium]|nr:diguanylate cyclase [Abditibacteriota bacterium]
MHSIRTKFTLLTLTAMVTALAVVTAIGMIAIKDLGRSDADQMIHLACSTGVMSLEYYFDSVEHSVETVSTLVHDSFQDMPIDRLDSQVERARNLFGKVASNTNGVLTYYFRIDPEVSDTVKGFWYVNLDGKGFREHEVTDINLYDTADTGSLVWFTVPKATGKGVWLPPYYTENLDVRVISYNVPVYRGDRFIGVVGIEIDYNTLAREAEKIKLFKTGYAFILDRDSKVICHPRIDSVQLDLETTALKHPEKHIGANHVRYTFEGVAKEAVWMPLSNGMRLFVAAPASEIDSSWRKMMLNTVLASLAVLLIIAVVMMRFAGNLAKPLRELTQAAKEVEAGKYDFSLEYSGDDEIGILTNAFRHLASHTREHISSLNRQVYIDALTSVRNKGGYADYIRELQDEMDGPNETPEFAFGVFDCDDLKYINDTYGHDKGDTYLRTACRLICRIFQNSPVFRIGGDEFAVILRGEDYASRDELLDRFREARAEICGAAKNEWDQVSVTAGIAVYDPQTDPSVIDVARRADRQMYENKRRRKAERETRV